MTTIATRRRGRPVGILSHHPKTVHPRAHPVITQLTELQLAAKLTDRALADKAGYPPVLPSFWRKNKRQPSLLSLSEFAQVFGYEVRLVPRDQP